MKIFLSWSTDRSLAVAKALSSFLPVMISGAEPFVSKDAIEAGGRWSQTIGAALETANFGIICLTPENVAKPWILFEAGAVSKQMTEGAVVPYLFDMSENDLSRPLSQFQAKKANEDGTFDVVSAINKRAQRQEPDHILRTRFKAAWPALQNEFDAIPKPKDAPALPVRQDREILEEVEIRLRYLIDEVTTIKSVVQTPQYPGTFMFSGSQPQPAAPSVPNPATRAAMEIIFGNGKKKLTRTAAEAFVTMIQELSPNVSESDVKELLQAIDKYHPKKE